MAEAFEVAECLKKEKESNTWLFHFQSDLTAGILAHPGLAARRSPFVLPFPCHRTHTVEIEFTGLEALSLPLFQAGTEYFSFNRRSRGWPKSLKVTFFLETLADSLPPERECRNIESRSSPFGKRHRLTCACRQVMQGCGNVVTSVPSRLPGQLRPPLGHPLPLLIQAKKAATIPTPIEESTPKTAAERPNRDVSPKPMPPARDSNAFRLPKRETPDPQREVRKQKVNRRCLWSFYILLAALAGFLTAYVLAAHSRATTALAGLIGLLVIPTTVLCLILAIVGLQECVKYPARYPRGVAIATVTLVFGTILALFLCFAVIGGIKNVRARSEARNQSPRDSHELLKFHAFNFNFQSPGLPWVQADARILGPSFVLGFKRPGQINFAIALIKLESGYLDPRAALIEKSKAIMRHDLTSFEVIHEEEVTYNGLAGWQIKGRGSFQGREVYIVQWVFANNGIGYQLGIWGRPGIGVRD